MKQVSIFAENKPGRIEKITAVLKDAQVNILAINISTSGTFGVIKLIVSDSDLAYRRLKEQGFTVSLNEVLSIEMADRPGGLHAVAAALARHGINVENAYPLVVGARGSAYLIVETADVAAARAALQGESLRFYPD